MQKELDLNHEYVISKIPDLVEVSFYDKINDIIKIKRVVKYKLDENYIQTQVTEQNVKEQITILSFNFNINIKLIWFKIINNIYQK